MEQPLKLQEKIGYGLGDAAANLVWRGALAYLAVFYTDTFGLSAAAAAMLFLIVRLSDGVTDIIMGMVADRTQTRMGKFRPWILGSTPLLGLFMVLCFTTPDFSDTGKLVYAYLTYTGLTLAYTLNNVPYSALMGVMTSDDQARTKLSGFRFAGAFLGGLLVMGCLPSMVAFFGEGDQALGYQYTMYVFASLLVIMMLITVFTTKERVPMEVDAAGSLKQELTDLARQLPFILTPLIAITAFFYYRNIYSGVAFVVIMIFAAMRVRRLVKRPEQQNSRSQQDIVDLLTNKPWLILLGMGFLTMMFNGIKYGVIAYYFKYYIGDAPLIGYYFTALLIISVFGALATPWLSRRVGRKALFVVALVASSLLTASLYLVPERAITSVFVLGCGAEFFAAIMPTLFFSMLGDAADYNEWKTGRRATGLVYSAGTFVQKTGGGFAGALVLLVLGSYGYNGLEPDTIMQSLPGMRSLMSWIPACFGLLGAMLILLYPLNDKKQQQVTATLLKRRSAQASLTA